MMIERHLQRERDQLPEAAAPGVDDLPSGRRASRSSAATTTMNGGEQREDEGVGDPALGPVGQRERGARDKSRLRRGFGG